MKLIKSRPAFAPEPPFRPVPYYLGHLFIYLGLLLVILVLGWLSLKASRIYTGYRATTQDLAALAECASARQTGFTKLDLKPVQASLQDLTNSLDRLQHEARPFWPLSRQLGWLPGYGADLQAAPALLAAGRDLGQAGLILVDTLEPLIGAEADMAPGSRLPELVTRLDRASAELQQLEVRLRQHQATLAAIQVEQLSPATARRLGQLQRVLPAVISGLQVSRGLPELLGAESPRTYLILTQNSDELRPAGGYITAAGHIVFDRGQIVEFVMQDSYTVDRLSEAYPYPPEPLYQYMAADYWVLRDASWSPDFPTAARTAIRLYELGQNVSAEGVVALDQQALPYLLRAIGPLEVGGEQVTDANVIPLMRQHWAPQAGQAQAGAWWSQRKSFMLALAEKIRSRLEQELGPDDLPLLAAALPEALAEKHILIHLEDPHWAELLAEWNWNGALQSTGGDYLMVVEANLGFNKASALVERQLNYQVDLAQDGRAWAEVNLVYQHPAPRLLAECSPEPRYDPVYEQNMERCYWNYLRLVVPAAAQLTRGPNVVVGGQYLLRGQPTTGEISRESLGADKVSWGQLFLLAPQETVTLAYAYTLPVGTAQRAGAHWVYNLYLQKQPGTLAPTAEVVVSLPAGARFVDSQPPPTGRQGTVLTYLINLRHDQAINVLYDLVP